MRYLAAALLLCATVAQAQESMTQDEINFLSLPLCKIERQWIVDGISMKFIQKNRMEVVKQLRKHPADARKVYRKIQLDQTADGSAAACAGICAGAGVRLYEARNGGPPIGVGDLGVVGCLGCVWGFRNTISGFFQSNLEQSAIIFGGLASAFIGTAYCSWSRCWENNEAHSDVDFMDAY